MLRFLPFIILVLLFVPGHAQNDSNAITIAPLKTDSIPKPKKKEKKQDPAPPQIGEVFKPKISLGAGMMSFYGDLHDNNSHFQAPWTARTGFDLNISQRLYKSLQLNFTVLFGKVGAEEWTATRQQNFQSEIRSGGISLMYDFGNFIPDKYKVRPWVSLGVTSFEFLSKTDLYDNKGRKYYYWSDGSIKNMAEGSPGSQNAIDLVRDYRYETDIRELNADGFGKYPERAWAFPVGAGALMKVTDRMDFKIGAQFFFTTTDYIDGITSKSVGNRKGNKANDRFMYTSFAFQYDLVIKRKDKDTLSDAYFDDVNWLAIDSADYDHDGVRDWTDKCQCTPKGVPVDTSGCPFDEDKDGVPDYADDELQSPPGVDVNARGVALTDEYWQDWYNHYMDSTGEYSQKVVVENFYAQTSKAKQDSINQALANEKNYTIELGRYQGPLPADAMTYILSIGDIRSAILSDNNTVVYTSGSFKDINKAVRKRDQYIEGGNSKARIGYFKNDDFIALTDDEISTLAGNATPVSTGTNSATTNTTATTTASTSTTNTNTAVNSHEEDNNSFGKDDVVYRVQLGAYKHKISRSVFSNAGYVVEIEADNGVYRYVTKGFKSINEAAALKANMVVDGYADAFIAAYKNGKRIPLDKTAATVTSKTKENLDEKAVFSSVNKDLISFRIQLGALRKPGDTDFEEKTKEFTGIEKQATASGMLRYLVGDYKDYSKADKYREELNSKGYPEAFVVAIFKGEIISIQEALELLK